MKNYKPKSSYLYYLMDSISPNDKMLTDAFTLIFVDTVFALANISLDLKTIAMRSETDLHL